jgi:Lon protease-like protein
MLPKDDLRDFDGVTRLFPLRGVVLFPNVILPLHIFEPRYRQMTEHALAGDQRISLIQSRPSLETTYPDRPPLLEVGCLGRIVQHERLPDGRFNILLLGVRRFRLERELDAKTLYRQAEVRLLEEPSPTARSTILGLDLAREFERIVTLDPDWRPILQGNVRLGVLTDLFAHAFQFPAEVKQTLLEEVDPDRRAELLLRLFRAVGDAHKDDSSGHRPPPSFSLN